MNKLIMLADRQTRVFDAYQLKMLVEFSCSRSKNRPAPLIYIKFAGLSFLTNLSSAINTCGILFYRQSLAPRESSFYLGTAEFRDINEN